VVTYLNKADKEIVERIWALTFESDEMKNVEELNGLINEIANLSSIIMMKKSEEYLKYNKIEDKEHKSSRKFLDRINKQLEKTKENK